MRVAWRGEEEEEQKLGDSMECVQNHCEHPLQSFLPRSREPRVMISNSPLFCVRVSPGSSLSCFEKSQMLSWFLG